MMMCKRKSEMLYCVTDLEPPPLILAHSAYDSPHCIAQLVDNLPLSSEKIHIPTFKNVSL